MPAPALAVAMLVLFMVQTAVIRAEDRRHASTGILRPDTISLAPLAC
jgi:hypothetical protein